jgi:choline dehydrogenase-like flavoprotein
MAIAAGETWGGGGTVNWSASFQLPGYVRREWASKGLTSFASSTFQESVERVSKEMGVSAEHIKHSIPNQKLAEGARRMGWKHADIAQNTGGNEHSCGHCSMGCRSSGKQGPAVSWLPKAASFGARFMEGFEAHEVLFEKKSLGGDKIARGVRGTWRSRDEHGGVAGKPVTTREVVIKAKKVIVSAGTMQSPLLLLRSGLSNRQIGRNLYLHPVSIFGATYEEETVPWDGPILSTVCSEFENLDGHGHGVKLEALSMMAFTWLNWVPWVNGVEYKKMAARMRHMGGYISIPRDRDTGRVYPDPTTGQCKVAYTTSKFDKNHILEGLVALAQLHFEAGAQELFTTVPGTGIWERQGDAEAAKASFDKWVVDMRRIGFPSPENMFISAHQMGTCRMSSTSKGGVVDENGQVWGTKGLYVADASVFPTASGVNPMLTVMSVSDHIATRLAAGLTKQRL